MLAGYDDGVYFVLSGLVKKNHKNVTFIILLYYFTMNHD